MAKKPWEETYATRNVVAPSSNGVSPLESFLSGAGDALTFGWGDELLGLGAGLIGMNGDDVTAWSRLQQRDAADANGLLYGAGQIGGSFVGGLGVGGAARAGLTAANLGAKAANAARGVGLLGRIGVGGATGAAGGAAYGAGSANDEDRFAGATSGAIWGGIGGAGGQAIMGELLPHLGSGIAKQLSPDRRATDVLAKTLERFGQSEGDLMSAIQKANAPGAPAGTLALDVIKGAPQVLKGAAVRPSAGRDALRDVMDTRNNAIAEETASDLWNTLGTGLPRDAAQRVKSLSDIQEQMAKPLYGEVYQTRVAAVPKSAKDFVAFNSRDGARFNTAINEARESMRRTLGVNVTDEVLMQYPQFWHTVLHNVEDRVGRAIAGAKMDPLGAPMGKSVAEMAGDARKFNDTVRNMLGDKFKKAQDIYSGAAKSKAAEEFGQEMVTASGDLELGKVAERLAKMTPGEKQHAQYGALSALEEMMRRADTGSGKVNPLRAIIGNASKRRNLQHVFGQSQGFDDLMSRMETRQRMFQNTVESGVGVNSHTAPVQAARDSFEAATNPTIGGIKGFLIKMLAGDSQDAYNETISNKVIDLMKMPTSDLEQAITRAGGFQQWLQQKGLLQAAIQQQKRMRDARPQKLANAATSNLWANVYGSGFGEAGGL